METTQQTITSPPRSLPPSNSFTHSSNAVTLPPVSPAIKPTSRARVYRIPNTSEAAGDIGNVAGGDSFLWATREIAALDFLMNVPLSAEREIVRAGLSGERWHRHDDLRKAHNKQPPDGSDIELGISGVIDECAETHFGLQHHYRSASVTISRNPSIEDETSTMSTIHSFSQSEKGSSSSAVNTAAASAGQRWWDKLILKDKRFFSAANQQAQRREQLEMEERDLECPSDYEAVVNEAPISKRAISTTPTNAMKAASIGIPGRRLDGREAVALTIPTEFRTRPLPIRTVARQAAVREWEMKVAWYGVAENSSRQYESRPERNKTKALLDGRVFFSSKKSYPMAVFSVIKYEPQKEEAARRRKKLEELGGGGTQFVLPERDWRGVSYRALLPQKGKQEKAFNRLLGNTPPSTKKKSEKAKKTTASPNKGSSEEDSDYEQDSTSVSSDESDDYVPGFLDDPNMKQGRHRNVMVGDKVTGPIISSTIQFVKPSVLKAELNKQFRERFDQWEPPKSQRKFIGAVVIDGVYTLIDPTETVHEDGDNPNETRRLRSGSLGERETIRMPPSLTLSKIRSLKQQALVACVRSQIELSTLALACVYFERLCLDCRVDKSNRRLSFAACLLLAAKVNESNTMIAFDPGAETKSWVKPSRKSGKIFESLVVFFTHDWSISLKQLYAAEWIVFTALGFSLKSTPSQVAFHFKRLLKVLEWDSRSYLGNEMYAQWQECLLEESRRKERRKARRELRVKKNERRLLKLQRKLHLQQTEGANHRRASTSTDSQGMLRRHSISTLDSTVSGTPQQDKSGTVVKGPLSSSKVEGSPAAVRGILSRITRSKIDSHVKELDRLPKRTWACHSYSVPNLTSLERETKNDDFAVGVCKIPERDHIPHSKDDAEMSYHIV